MAAIKLLNGPSIPIIGHTDFPGTDPLAINPADIESGSPESRWAQGVNIGEAEYTKYGCTESSTFTNCKLNLHDGWEIDFDTFSIPYVIPSLSVQVQSMLAGVQTSMPGCSLANFTIYPGSQGITTLYTTKHDTRMSAYTFSWPEAPDHLNAHGVIIFATRKEEIYREDGSLREEVYHETYQLINVPYVNKSMSTEYYFTEQATPEDENPPLDPSIEQPMNPKQDNSSDTIPLPSSPTIGVTSAGFINVYKPSVNSLAGLGDILFPNVASATDVVDAVIKLCETLANQNLINYVIDCHVIPAAPVTGQNANIKVGFRDTGISVPRVTNDYVDVSCGSLSIAEYYGNFADFLYTRSKLYLPFLGFVDVLPEFWQAGTISVDYKFNVIDGSFMVYIRSTSSKSQLYQSVIAQYSGVACSHFPLTGVNYSAMVSGILGAGIAAASGGTSAAVLGSAYSAANTFAQGGNVQQSNGYNSTAALMGIRKPYLLIERPVASYSAKYAHSKGYPSNIATALSNVTGYTEIEDIDLTGIPLTQTEIEELRTLLSDGVYF